jgi:hypothetical protein
MESGRGDGTVPAALDGHRDNTVDNTTDKSRTSTDSIDKNTKVSTDETQSLLGHNNTVTAAQVTRFSPVIMLVFITLCQTVNFFDRGVIAGVLGPGNTRGAYVCVCVFSNPHKSHPSSSRHLSRTL